MNVRVSALLAGVVVLSTCLAPGVDASAAFPTAPTSQTGSASSPVRVSGSASGVGKLHTACRTIPDLRPNRFPALPSVNNPYLPYVAGTQTVLRGTVTSGGIPHPHKIVTTVTDLTKMIDGVRTAVVYEQDLQLGTVQESELLFVAQDVRGSVWHMGEYPEVYEHGRPGAPDAWLSGVAGAGIDMPLRPHVGEVLMQGYSPNVFYDCARVEALHKHICVPTGCYRHVVLTNEWSPIAPKDHHQLKYSAVGLGTILALPLHEPNPEVVRLAKVTCLRPRALAKIDRAAIAEDKRAYHVAAPVYAGSPPAVQTPGIQTCSDPESSPHRQRSLRYAPHPQTPVSKA